MTTALKAMVEAMLDEIRRQNVLDARADDPPATATVVFVNGALNLEKVARAGLEALQRLDDDALVDLILAGADMDDSVGIWWPRLVGAILKDQP